MTNSQPIKRRRGGRSDSVAGGFTDPHVLRSLQYADSVLAGKVSACRLAVAAAERFKRDLSQIANPGWPYYFDESRAGRVCRFVELLPHVKGPKASDGQLLRLEPWQSFILCQFFGWLKKAPDEYGRNNRRFSRSIVFIPRGNGKTALGAAVMLYALCADGEQGAEVYSAAVDREQAEISFDSAAAMLERRPDLKSKLGLETWKRAILHNRTNSSYKTLSKEARRSGDGKNVHAALLDEIHAHPTREVHDLLETGAQKRKQSFLWIISTAGNSAAGVGFEQYTYAKRILEGTAVDESVFAAIWEADEGDLAAWDSPEVWAKCNPNLGISVELQGLQTLATKARQVPSARAAFFTRHLNRWLGAHAAFINLAHWDRCTEPGFNREEFAGAPVWIGIDLASRKDLTAIAYVWRRMEDGAPHWYVAVDCYLPESAIAESPNASYRGWAADGYIKVNDGDEIDYQLIENEILRARDRFEVMQVAFDNYQPGAAVAQRLALEGFQTVEVRTTYLQMNSPMRELESALAAGRVHFEPNECLRWQATNLIGKLRGDEVRPEKEHAENKIDGVVALLMALNRAMVDETAYADGEGLKSL